MKIKFFGGPRANKVFEVPKPPVFLRVYVDAKNGVKAEHTYMLDCIECSCGKTTTVYLYQGHQSK